MVSKLQRTTYTKLGQFSTMFLSYKSALYRSRRDKRQLLVPAKPTRVARKASNTTAFRFLQSQNAAECTCPVMVEPGARFDGTNACFKHYRMPTLDTNEITGKF